MKTPTETAGAPTLAPISFQAIRVADIVPDPRNLKRPENIDVLAATIEREGLLQPIVVRPNPTPKAKEPWMLVAGERRWEAHKLLKRETIMAQLVAADGPADLAVRRRHAENFHREDLSPIQRAKALQELFELKMSQAEIAAFVGVKDQSTVSNLCRLLRLPAKVQDWIHEGKLTAAHGKALLRFEKFPKLVEAIAERAIDQGASTKALEKGLPFLEDLIEDEYLFDFEWTCGALKDLPEQYRTDPDFIEAENDYQELGLYCLDVAKGKRVAKEITEATAKRDAARSVAKAKSSADAKEGGGLSASELAERKKKVTDNKRRRLAVQGTLAQAKAKLAAAPAFDLPKESRRLLDVVLEAAVEDGRHGSRLKEAAKLLGVEIGNTQKNSGYYRVFQHKELQGLSAPDALRVVALAVILRQCDDSERFAAGVPDFAEHVAGGVVKVPPVTEATTPKGHVLEMHMRRSIARELAVTWQTPRKIGEMFGVPDEWVKIVRADKQARDIAGVEYEWEAPEKKSAEKPAAKPVVPATQAKTKVAPSAKVKKTALRALITDATRAEVLKLVHAGKTGMEIAKIVGISLPSVQNIKKQLGLVRPAKKGGPK